MSYQLHHGDCLEVMMSFRDESIDLVFTSPPYFNAREYAVYGSYSDYLDFLDKVILSIYRIVSKDGFFVLNVSPVITAREKRSAESIRHPIPFDVFGIAQDIGFKYIDDIIWKKPVGSVGKRGSKFAQTRKPCAYKPLPVTEYLLVFRKKNSPLIDRAIRKKPKHIVEGSLVTGDYETSNVWEINPETKVDHPAPFPLRLASNIVRYYSFVGDTVLDPFMGSATTGVAALTHGRKFVGIEKEHDYLVLAKSRLEGVEKATS